MSEVLSFDWGTSIIGVLDIDTGTYTPYRSTRMIEGAQLIQRCKGVVVSFNGNACDLPELAKLLRVKQLRLAAQHYDMLELTSKDRWPPKPGTAPILGQNLSDTYIHYFGSDPIVPPPDLRDEYEIDNWRDCFRAAELWKRCKNEQHNPPQSGP